MSRTQFIALYLFNTSLILESIQDHNWIKQTKKQKLKLSSIFEIKLIWY